MTTTQKIRALLSADERRSAYWLLCLMSIGMLLEMLGIGLIIPVIALMMQDDIAARYPAARPILEFLGNPGHTQLIMGTMLGLVGIYLVKNLFLAFLAWGQTRFTFDVQLQISQRLFTTYLYQPYTFHLQRNSAQLTRNVISEVALFISAVKSVLTIVSEGLVLFGISAMLLLAEPLGALAVAVVLGVSAWSFHRITRARILRWGKARQYHDGLRMQHLQQGLGGAKDVKLLGREDDFLAQYRTHNLQSARVGQFQAVLTQLPRLWLELLAVSGLALLVLSMLAQGRNMSSVVPTLALFAAAAFRLLPSINKILNALQSLRFAAPVINTLHEEFTLPLHKSDASQSRNTDHVTAEFETEIRLSNISYTYAGAASAALDDLSIVVRKGESVGFIGHSGSGKSTLVDVMLGLLPPGAGQVLVDGNDIQHDLRAWQDQIGYVPQSIYLTDDTLKRNVAFGVPREQIDEEAVLRAIKSAQLEEFVAGLQKGIETVVGERGVRLSGGQRQRIGIARAMYHDPAVLVLDEATSALDTATESDVMQAVTALRKSKTILIVAHRLSTVEHCDRLYRLEHGKVVAEGAPTEIISIV